MKKSFKKSLLIHYILVSVLPLLVVAVVIFPQLINSYKKDVADKSLVLARSIATEVGDFLSHHEAELRHLAYMGEQGVFEDEKAFLAFVSSSLQHKPFFENILLLDTDGTVIAAAPDDPGRIGYSMASQPYYKKERVNGEVYWSPPQFDNRSNELTLPVSISCRGGVLVGNVKVSILNTASNRVEDSGMGLVFITDQNGIVIAHPDKYVVTRRVNLRNLDIIIAGLAGQEESQLFTIGNQEFIGSAVIVPGTQWVVVYSELTREAFLIIAKVELFFGGGMLITLFLALFLSLWDAGHIVNPLRQLVTSTQEISKGDYDIRIVSDNTYSELDVLAQQFLLMSRAIKTREMALQESNRQLGELRSLLSNIINSMPSILIAVDVDGIVTQWNQEAEYVTGVAPEQAVGMHFSAVVSHLASEVEQVKKTIETGVEYSNLRCMRIVEGERRYEDVSVYPLVANGVKGAVIRVDDVTERIQLEEVMVQTEKMMSVGGLAAGMAHEINNPLGIIVQAVQNIERRVSSDFPANEKTAAECGTSLDKVRDYLGQRMILTMISDIRVAGGRAAKIVANMLQFSRRSESFLRDASIPDLIDQTIELAGSDYDLKKKYDFRQINIVREYEPELPLVQLAVTEFEQVILNLLKNAAQAMAEADMTGREATIILRVCKRGDSVQVDMQDNGPGMEEAVCKRVFEPFFTTKAVGSGTGLGLSVSYMIIVSNHKGSMDVESVPGVGTTFRLSLPLGGDLERIT